MAGKPRAIQALSDYTESLNMLFYADSGVGKTVLCGTAPKSLFLATEPGTVAAKKQGSKAEVWPIDSHAELMRAHKWLEENPTEYEWGMIDGLTNLQEILWRESIEKGRNINPDRDPDILAQQDYLRVQNQIKEVVRLFNDLPINMIYTAQTMRSEDEDDEVLMLPLLSGKKGEFAQKICGMVHVVGHLTVVTPREKPSFRRLHTQREGKIFAKDRYDAVGRMDNPTIGRIAQKIEASITDTTAPKPAASKAAPAARPRKATAARPRRRSA